MRQETRTIRGTSPFHLVGVVFALLAFQSSTGFGNPHLRKPPPDPRNIELGSMIPDEGYCDQPYIVVTRDGAWLCTLTTGQGREGQQGQHVVSTISTDDGKTWSPLLDIEPADGPEASWAMPLIVPSGRVYVFYNYNGDRVNQLGDKVGIRADTLGWYVYKYSDDNGRSWSSRRFRLPIRHTAMDRTNAFKGQVQMFWGIGKPVVVGKSVFLGFSKVESPDMRVSEGWFMRSDNLLTEPDPDKHEWQMLPEGDVGLRSIAGPIAEEQNLVGLSDGSLYTMYRTVEGHPCHAYSHDGGRSWTPAQFAEYAPGGRLFKNPRACPRLWKTSNGKYLFWFHHNGLKWFFGRNPAWIVGGVERDGRLHWSQPEIILYDPSTDTRISYPDLIERDGRYWITETQKTIARVHEIDPSLLEGMWRQVSGGDAHVSRAELVLTADRSAVAQGEVEVPAFPVLQESIGFTLEFRMTLKDITAGAILWDSRDAAGQGILVRLAKGGVVRTEMNDGRTGVFWDSDPGLLTAGRPHHVVITVDSRARVLNYIIDGVMCDGGKDRPFGWCRFSADLADINGSNKARVGVDLRGHLDLIRVYHRPLRTYEAVSNYQAVRREEQKH